LKIIPVMDILNGTVVHAIKGKREDYQQLQSVLVDSPDPMAVALMFEALGFLELYIADLNAIMKNGNNLLVIKEITAKTKLKVMLDFGVSRIDVIERLFDIGTSKVIVGSESMVNLDLLKKILSRYGSEKIIVSLDMMNGRLLGSSEKITSLDPLDLAIQLRELEVDELILLDLKRVGSEAGINISFLKKFLKVSNFKLYVGGGVRDENDLEKLKALGIFGVLVATALHSGLIKIDKRLTPKG
jgi:phosphoribosylformimino-5-aminoimidazole carboxamide ribotide isomerase